MDLQPLLEGEDYYLEGKAVVFRANSSAARLLLRESMPQLPVSSSRDTFGILNSWKRFRLQGFAG